MLCLIKVKPETRKYQPIEIFEIFKEQHRLVSPIDPEADKWTDIELEMSVADWMAANDLLPWKKLYPVYNTEFGTDISEEEWKQVLVPARKKKLLGVCELLARYADKEIIESKRILGTDCISAAIFLTLKRNLAERGLDVSELRPSSELKDFFNADFNAMLSETLKIGSRGITALKEKRAKTGFWNTLNIFDPNRYYLIIEGCKTFRELVVQIEKEKQGTTTKIN